MHGAATTTVTRGLAGFAGRRLSDDGRIAVITPSAAGCRPDRSLRGMVMMPMRGLMSGRCERWRGENRESDRT